MGRTVCLAAVENEDTEYLPYPVCEVRVCDGLLLAFGGEPIKSIWLAAETRGALENGRHSRAVSRH
jgi:hypothetical protein